MKNYEIQILSYKKGYKHRNNCVKIESYGAIEKKIILNLLFFQLYVKLTFHVIIMFIFFFGSEINCFS